MSAIGTPRLLLRTCREADRDLFFDLGSDPAVLAFFPFRLTRDDVDAIFDRILDAAPAPGFELLTMVLKRNEETIGFCGLSKPHLEPFLPKDAVEIGWRISARHWCNGYATEAGEALLRHAFDGLRLEEILSVAVHDNHAALAVMRKIGLRPDPARDFDHPQIPHTHPHLKRHAVHRLSAAEWRARRTP